MDNYQHTLKKANLIRKRKPCQIIDMISNSQIEKNDVPIAYRELFDKSPEFLSFLKNIISKKSNPLTDGKYIQALYEMFVRKDKWVRNING